MSKYILAVLLICGLMLSFVSSAQNLLNMEGWTIGEDESMDFYSSGGSGSGGSENNREWGIGPQGQRAIIWRSTANPNYISTPKKAIGLVYLPLFPNHTKMYRFSIWLKIANESIGETIVDLMARVEGLDGSNDYSFFNGDLPESEKWYLMVGYLHASNDQSTTSYGAIYDGLTGEKHELVSDLKFLPRQGMIGIRALLAGTTSALGTQYFYAPRFDEMNGNEPTINELLNLGFQGMGQLSIGTDKTPEGYTVSVAGNGLAEKVKVEAAAAWPDYVFEKNYSLMSLEELRDFISKRGHLPNLPTAEDIKNTNQNLGLVQQKLLEKIEELTLYKISQREELVEIEDFINRIEFKVNDVTKRNLELEMKIKKLENNHE